jgi:DNA-binding NarL/FixJ family response regulator
VLSCFSSDFRTQPGAGYTPVVEFNYNGGVAIDHPVVRERRRGSKIRVYIADDQVLLLRGLASMIRGERDLKLCGETSNCTSAIEEVCELRPDVVIMELSIGGGRGIELIENIKAIDPGIGVVVLSRLEEGLHALSALKAGAGAYITKQSPPSKVLDAIRKVCDGQMCVSDYVANRMFDRVANGQGTESFSPVSSLSPRELEIYKLIGAGRSSREIAELLQISFKTVETHRAHIKEKANLTSGFELMLSSMRWSGAAAC